MFIDIENKENSAVKMAAVEGQPTKYYLFAQELNTIVSAINSLRHLISLNEGNIQILLSTAPKIELGTIEVDFVDEINAMEEVEIPSPVFITFTKDDIFYVYAFAGEANTYGTLNGLFVSAGDFLPVYQSDEQGAVVLQNFQQVTEAGNKTTLEVEMKSLILNVLLADPSIPADEKAHIYALANTLGIQFSDGQFIKIQKNTSVNGVITMPFANGRIETLRPVTNMSTSQTYSFAEADSSKCLRVINTASVDFQIGTSMPGLPIFEFLHQSSGTSILSTQGVFKINGSLSSITLESNVLYKLKRVGTTDFVLTPKPGGAAVWGGITGTIADQTDLMSILLSVANTAQWGSIGGSLPSQTDLVNFIRLAAPDNSFLNVVPSGWITTLNNYTSVVTNGTFSSTVSNSNNLTRFQPFVTNTVVNIDELYLSVQNNNTGASATATLYVFASDNDGLPGTKLHQEISATNIFNTPNSIITFGNNFTLEPGVYWIGIHIRDLNLASSNPAFYFASLGGDVKGIQSAAITFTNNFQGVLSVAATVGDLSDNPAVIISASTALSVPMLKIKHQ